MPGIRLSAALLVVTAGSAVSLAQSFTVLAPLPDAIDAQAWNVSVNGNYFVGFCTDGASGDMIAVLWDSAGRPAALPMHGFVNIAFAVSREAAMIAGEYDGRAVIWGGGYGGDILLGPGSALDVSSDGGVTVGYRNPAGPALAFSYNRYVFPDPLINLPPASPDTDSYAQAVNGGSTFIAGYTARFEMGGAEFHSRACVWPVTGGAPTVLGDVPGHRIAAANDISEDGSVVVGNSACCEESFSSAVRWENGVPTVLTPGDFGNAHAVSADGSVVVGEGFGGAFVWDATHGVRSISDILTAAGVDLSGYFLAAARGVSGDGSVVTGWGFDNETFTAIAWSADLRRVCVVDLNGDGIVDFGDYLEFLNLFEASDPRVDFSPDGIIDFSDYLEFLNLYEAGC